MASGFKINARQLLRLGDGMRRAGVKYDRGKARLLKKMGVLVQGQAREYCPESPTLAQFAKLNKSGVTHRKRSGITTGSLRDSITFKTGRDEVSIFVAANSRGGDYAERIHDQKGVKWHKRGPRTVQKGAKADAKFIDRAYDDREKDIDSLIDDTMNELIKGI